MSFPLDLSPDSLCPFCNHAIIKVKYTGKINDGNCYQTQDDYARQQKDIIETVIMPHPEFDRKLFDKRMEEEYYLLQKTMLYTPICSFCGSSNIQFIERKRKLVKGYILEKVCVSCGKKVK
ncbi:MAG TPA: hypothetical protein DD733_01520 [Clostridiales bacterium]|nr:hypothetical protein [Clostridiales bacterium]